MADARPPEWIEPGALMAAQHRLARARALAWRPGAGSLRVGGCFVAFARGEQGPGRRGDRGWGGAAVVREDGEVLAGVVVRGVAAAGYAPGLLALREGSILFEAVVALPERPDVLLVDATGGDHPRRAGLALHLGWVLDVPTVGVTHRPLVASGDPPADDSAGATSPLLFEGDEVARWVRTQAGVRPLVAHAAWRTDPATAVEVVLRSTGRVRTPEPLRQARRLARAARAGRASEVDDGGAVGRAR